MVVLLVSPGGGDELQGIKKGIVEVADLIVVNKCDGDTLNIGKQTQSDYMRATQLMRPKTNLWRTPVLACSTLNAVKSHNLVKKGGSGIDDMYTVMGEYQRRLSYETGYLQEQRGHQRELWMWRALREELMDTVQRDGKLSRVLDDVRERLSGGDVTPRWAARTLVEAVFGENGK